MTFSNRNKAIGTLALALVAVTSLSVSAFAQDPSEVPMTELVPSTEVSLSAIGTEDENTVVGDVTESIPAAQLTEAEEGVRPADENAIVGDLTEGVPAALTTEANVAERRTNEKTGKEEVSADGGKTWIEAEKITQLISDMNK